MGCLTKAPQSLPIRKPAHETAFDEELGLQSRYSRHAPDAAAYVLAAGGGDDHVDNVNDSLAYYNALRKAGVPVEMHLYAEGGHGFGLRPTNLPITGWPQLVETWLRTIGMISE